MKTALTAESADPGAPQAVGDRHDPWRTHSVTLRRVASELPGVKTYDLAFDDPETAQRYRYAPGQFNMLYLPGVGEAAISVSGDAAERGVVRHTVRTVGGVTRALEALRVGDSLGLRGPFGRPWPVERLTSAAGRSGRLVDVILVAGGVGLAPLRSVITYLRRHRERVGRVDLLIGARTPDDLLYRDEYTGWGKDELQVQTTVDRAPGSWSGNVGVVTLLIDRLAIRHPESTVLLTCGPEVMMRYVAHAAVGRAIPTANLYVSLERHMNCAIGFCGHCQLGGEFVCKDGPVFSYDHIGPLLQVRDY